jgi:hypothetical protein
MTRGREITDAGHEVQCTKCEEFWPETPEFFFFTKGKPHSWCKACYREDPNIVAKDLRWRERQRKGPPPTPPPALDFPSWPLAIHLLPATTSTE